MKILYFGTVCDIDKHNMLLQECSYKPSVASVVFETALLEGFAANGAQLEIHSFPMIPAYPACRLLRYGGNTEKLASGYDCHLLGTVNVPVLKQLSRRRAARRALRRWLRENKDDGMILLYSMPPFLMRDVLSYGKKYAVKTVAIVPDLLRDMYANEPTGTWRTRLKQLYLKPALQAQGAFDGYVYLTDAMHSAVAPDKPYIVMEGIAGTAHAAEATAEKASPRAIMYAGMLHEKYGILHLVDAFQRLQQPDVELWLFGEGTAVPEIQRRSQTDSRIRWFGSVTRERVLEYERQATLLVNPRDPEEDFTQYSFPSKTVEYMLSRTPLLTTLLPGIPREYFQYVFCAEDNSPRTLAAAMEQALSSSPAALAEMGEKARAFVLREKNAKAQSAKILKFMDEVFHDTAN